NISVIYDLQEADGIRFLVLELIEGNTLADVLKKRGALPLDEALQIAQQVCEALEAAHSKGIIHRDLKPSNIQITPNGKVKLLDFGLAKQGSADSTVGTSDSSMLTAVPLTEEGMILGTVPYMSPEQVEGLEADARSDIFAFGTVLFEMAT